MKRRSFSILSGTVRDRFLQLAAVCAFLAFGTVEASAKLFDSLRKSEVEAIELLGIPTATKEQIKQCIALYNAGVDAFNGALDAWAGGRAESAKRLAEQGNSSWSYGCFEQEGCTSTTCNIAIGFSEDNGPVAYMCLYCGVWPSVPTYVPLKHFNE
jgi:hypothetical protein